MRMTKTIFPMSILFALAFSLHAEAQAELDTSVLESPVSAKPLYYPEDMKGAGVQGKAIVQCSVTVLGYTKNCVVVSSTNESFGASALDYFSHAQFKPVLDNGVPVEVKYKWTLTFSIQ